MMRELSVKVFKDTFIKGLGESISDISSGGNRNQLNSTVPYKIPSIICINEASRFHTGDRRRKSILRSL